MRMQGEQSGEAAVGEQAENGLLSRVGTTPKMGGKVAPGIRPPSIISGISMEDHFTASSVQADIEFAPGKEFRELVWLKSSQVIDSEEIRRLATGEIHDRLLESARHSIRTGDRSQGTEVRFRFSGLPAHPSLPTLHGPADFQAVVIQKTGIRQLAELA